MVESAHLQTAKQFVIFARRAINERKASAADLSKFDQHLVAYMNKSIKRDVMLGIVKELLMDSYFSAIAPSVLDIIDNLEELALFEICKLLGSSPKIVSRNEQSQGKDKSSARVFQTGKLEPRRLDFGPPKTSAAPLISGSQNISIPVSKDVSLQQHQINISQSKEQLDASSSTQLPKFYAQDKLESQREMLQQRCQQQNQQREQQQREQQQPLVQHVENLQGLQQQQTEVRLDPSDNLQLQIQPQPHQYLRGLVQQRQGQLAVQYRELVTPWLDSHLPSEFRILILQLILDFTENRIDATTLVNESSRILGIGWLVQLVLHFLTF